MGSAPSGVRQVTVEGARGRRSGGIILYARGSHPFQGQASEYASHTVPHPAFRVVSTTQQEWFLKDELEMLW